MRRIVIGIGVAVSAVCNAFAADLPPGPPPPPPRAPVAYIPAPPPVYDWTGIYVGINGGWGWGTANGRRRCPAGGNSFSNANDNGGIIGATFGANFQTGAFVFGIEGDWDYSGMNTGTSSAACAVIGTCQTGNNWLSTLRGRAGFAADRVLFYGTGGGIFANMQTALNGITTTHIQAGWTAGLGVEYAFTQNITAKVEYLYAQIGAGTLQCTTGPCGGTTIPVSVSLNESLIRAGINFKFNL